MAVCHICNNEGKEGGCPRCGLTPRRAVRENALQLEVPTEIIPTQYHGLMWERPEKEGLPLAFVQVDEGLEKVYNKFLLGEIPNFSLFISAPPKSGKNRFAYACMQSALTRRFSVAPLFSTGEWRRLYKTSQVNPMYKLFGKYRWDTLVSVDVLFMFIDHGEERYTDIPLLKSIMDTRATLGLSTFVISDYKLESLVPAWDSKVYTMIHNSSPDRDFLRYPVIFQRFN